MIRIFTLRVPRSLLTVAGLLPGLILSNGCSDDANGGGASVVDAGEEDVAVGPASITGPIAAGMAKPFTASVIDLAAHGYLEEEFFLEGSASAYAMSGEMTLDGKWTATTSTEADYKTRVLVRRPEDAGKFNGTVIVEWLNVSGGADGDPGFMYNWEEILREGYAFVGVSAQKTGVEGGGFAITPNAPPPLKQYDAERYGSLSHPGDAYSYDIFTQAVESLRAPGKSKILGGLKPKRFIAYGESQSAARMVTYVNAIQPLEQTFDGFYIHSRSSGGAPFGDGIGFGGSAAHIRDDLEQPVFQLQTETDVFGSFGYLGARQPDSDVLRSWEMAGTAHADAHIAMVGAGGADVSSIIGDCGMVNSGPQHFILKAALHALNAWMVDGTAPPTGMPLMADEAGTAPAHDALGNALGGIRTPHVDVPIATLSGANSTGSILCSLFGETKPFSAAKLLELYPTHAMYVDKVKAAAAKARKAGFLLAPEEAAMVADAEAADVPPE